jgi:hypothetical protein
VSKWAGHRFLRRNIVVVFTDVFSIRFRLRRINKGAAMFPMRSRSQVAARLARNVLFVNGSLVDVDPV